MVSPLDGLQPERTLYTGKDCSHRLTGLLSESELRARPLLPCAPSPTLPLPSV